jgi:cytochrome c-type biogenesis protein
MLVANENGKVSVNSIGFQRVVLGIWPLLTSSRGIICSVNRRVFDVEVGLWTRLFRAIIISGAVTAGFVLLFGSVGLVVATGGQFVVDAMPWLGFSVGAILMLLGMWLLAGGRPVFFVAAQRAGAKMGGVGRRGVPSFFMFGVAYGLASLSCTLPIFLIVVVSSSVAGSFVDGVFQFVAYAMGMGAVLIALTLSTAVFKGAMAVYLRGLLPYMQRISAVLIIMAGAFVVYYWASIGGLGPATWQNQEINAVVESVLGSLTNEASAAVFLVPGYAFASGMLATINPCGFALLPAYLSFYLAGNEE